MTLPNRKLREITLARPTDEALMARAFELYLALGDERSYKLVAASVGRTERTIQAWATAGDWQARIHELLHRNRAVTVTEERAGNMLDRHLEGLHRIQEVALNALETSNTKDALDSAKVLTQAFKEERSARVESGNDDGETIQQMLACNRARWVESLCPCCGEPLICRTCEAAG